MIDIRRRCRDYYGEVKDAGGPFNLRQSLLDMAGNKRTLNKRVVCNDMNPACARTSWQGNQMLNHQVRDERAVLAPGEADDPGFLVWLGILNADFLPDAPRYAIRCCPPGILGGSRQFFAKIRTNFSASA